QPQHADEPLPVDMLAQVQAEEGRRGLGGGLHPGLVLAMEGDRLAAVQEHPSGCGGVLLSRGGPEQGTVQADRGRSHADRPDPGGAGQQQLPPGRPVAVPVAGAAHRSSSSSSPSSSPCPCSSWPCCSWPCSSWSSP